MRFIVGLTGGIGSGKSAVAALFEAHGVPVIDTDAIAHELTASGGAAIAPIRECFGPEYIAENGALDRAKMRDTVFANAAARHRLEGILHPLIRTATAGRTLAAPGPYVILMIPLLVESGNTRDRAQRLLVVDCTDTLPTDRAFFHLSPLGANCMACKTAA